MTAPKTCPRGLHLFAGRKCPACLRADAANAAALDELELVVSRVHRRGRSQFVARLPPPGIARFGFIRQRGSK